jgi:hypothetical protein
MALLMI